LYVFPVCYSLVVSISAIREGKDWKDSFPKGPIIMLSGTLNPTHYTVVHIG